jgi:hypothetical protein
MQSLRKGYYCHVYVTNITGSGLDDSIYWHFYYDYIQLWQLTISDCLRLAPFLTGLRASSLPLRRVMNDSRIGSWFSFLLRLPWTTTVWRKSSFFSARLLIYATGNYGKVFIITETCLPNRWLAVDFFIVAGTCLPNCCPAMAIIVTLL